MISPVPGSAKQAFSWLVAVQGAAGRRTRDGEGGSGRALGPGAVEVALGAPQARIVELHRTRKISLMYNSLRAARSLEWERSSYCSRGRRKGEQAKKETGEFGQNAILPLSPAERP